MLNSLRSTGHCSLFLSVFDFLACWSAPPLAERLSLPLSSTFESTPHSPDLAQIIYIYLLKTRLNAKRPRVPQASGEDESASIFPITFCPQYLRTMYEKAIIHTLFIWYECKQPRLKADSGCGCDDGPIIHGYCCGGGVVKVWESFNWHQLGLLLHVDLWFCCQQSRQQHGGRSGVWFIRFPAWSLILYFYVLTVDHKILLLLLITSSSHYITVPVTKVWEPPICEQ